MNKTLHILSIAIIILAGVTAGFGLFYHTAGQSFDFVNQYGDTVKIYGEGIYKADSFFMAQIFNGTDFMLLFLAIPLLVIVLIRDIKKNTLKTKLLLTATIVFFLYYSLSCAIGIKYNALHLVYTALFSCSLFASVVGYGLLKNYSIQPAVKLNTIGLKIFLVFCGLSLFVAWLPDILVLLLNNKPLAQIEIYTTQITYVLDMAIVSPVIFICLYHLSKGTDTGYILLGIILNMLVLVGVMVVFQTILPAMAGIELPIEAAITKVGIFVVLAIIGVFYEWKLFKRI